MSFFVYILFSRTTQRFYIGQTGDIQKRIQSHNEGRSPSTRFGRPWTIEYIEVCATRAEAVRRERYLKSLKSAKALRSIIEETQSQSG